MCDHLLGERRKGDTSSHGVRAAAGVLPRLADLDSTVVVGLGQLAHRGHLTPPGTLSRDAAGVWLRPL